MLKAFRELHRWLAENRLEAHQVKITISFASKGDRIAAARNFAAEIASMAPDVTLPASRMDALTSGSCYDIPFEIEDRGGQRFDALPQRR